MSQVSETFHLLEVPASPPCDGKRRPLGGGGSKGQGVRQFLKVRDERTFGSHPVQLPYCVGGKPRPRDRENAPQVVQIACGSTEPGALPAGLAFARLCHCVCAVPSPPTSATWGLVLPEVRPQGRVWTEEERSHLVKGWDPSWVVLWTTEPLITLLLHSGHNFLLCKVGWGKKAAQ